MEANGLVTHKENQNGAESVIKKRHHSREPDIKPNMPHSNPNDEPGAVKRLEYLNDVLSSYLVAARAWSFSASLTPLLLGIVLAWNETGKFNPWLALLTGLTIISVHGAGNLVNTYYDFLRGVDNEESDDRTLVHKILSPEEVVRLGVVLYAVGSGTFLATLVISNAHLEHLCLLFFTGLSGSFLYTGSIGLKYYALGDIVIFLMFGPVSVLYAYTAQTGQPAFHPLSYAFPLVLNTEAILHSNNSRDMDSDREYGVLTLSIILGKELSYVVYCVLLFSPYFMVLFFAINQSWLFLLPCLTLTYALHLEKEFRCFNLSKVPRETAKLNLMFGFLYTSVFCFCTTK